MYHHIKSVNGNVKLKEFTIIDGHNHVYIKKIKNMNYEKAIVIDNFNEIMKGLFSFKKIGGSAIVDCQPWESGRDCNILKKLSLESNISIIAVTGFHKREYYAKDSVIWQMSDKRAQSFFECEIINNLYEDNGINNIAKAQIIKIAYIGKLEGQYLTLTNAAVNAAIKTNSPIMVHTEKGINILELINYFEGKGVMLDKIMICHIDKNIDIKLHKTLIKKGVYLEYDTFLKEKYNPIKNVWPLLVNIIDAGNFNKVVIGGDATPNYSLQDKDGLANYFTHIEKKLESLKINKKIINRIIGQNMIDFLTKN